MIINGLLLPDYLVKLISNDRWKTPSDQTRLEQLTGIKGVNSHFNFHTLPDKGLCRVKEDTHLYDDPQVADVYGLASSEQLGHEILNLEFLDVDKAIYLASNVHEDAICLDYRTSKTDPCIVVSIWEVPINVYRWKKIANNIQEFADYIKL